MKEGTERRITAGLLVLGIPLVAYGMASKSHPLFLLGIGLVIVGYLRIRTKLRHSHLNRS